MSLPPLLRLGSSFESFISGEVIVHPSAVIAPGVILFAAPNSKIIIGAGVCIGMGSVIQVDTGILEIEAGASLGAGFLMVGQGRIGANACIGAATTVFKCSVPSGQVVAPGSILGDQSRNTIEIETVNSSQPTLNPTSSSPTPLNSTQSTQQELEDAWEPSNNNNSFSSNNSNNINNGYNSSSTIKQLNLDSTSSLDSSNQVPLENTSSLPSPDQPKLNAIEPQANIEQDTFGTHISGKASIQRLLVTLFPHRQALNKPLLDDDDLE
jgi:carbon dioxide concentrating mechanism protein CcmN